MHVFTNAASVDIASKSTCAQNHRNVHDINDTIRTRTSRTRASILGKMGEDASPQFLNWGTNI